MPQQPPSGPSTDGALIGELCRAQIHVRIGFESGDDLILASPALQRNDLTDSQLLAFLTLQFKELLTLAKRKLQLRRQSAVDWNTVAPDWSAIPIPPADAVSADQIESLIAQSSQLKGGAT